jgi:predicted TIM-barrel fold metal-dependent hydrolase
MTTRTFVDRVTVNRRVLAWGLPLLLAGCAGGGVGQGGRSTPAADHHQHLFSPDIVALLGSDAGITTLDAHQLVPLLDSAGIRRAILLSVAYMYGSPRRSVEDEHARVRAENDWTAAQAALYPDRLVAFCGLNPLKEYALEEIARCADDRRFGRGVKFHFGNSDVRLDDSSHVQRLREVFRFANDRRMAIVVHLRASISLKRPYGAAQAQVFLEQLLPLAPDITVQVAHLGGTGPGYDDPPADSALAVLAEALEGNDRRTRGLWIDVAGVVDTSLSPADAGLVARRIRQVGIERILYGSDGAVGEDRRPRRSWASFTGLPLTDDEIARIADNLAPYMR